MSNFPVDADRITTNVNTATDVPVFNLPSGIKAGDLLALAWRSGATVTSPDNLPSGWTGLFAGSGADGSDDFTRCMAKIADGTEGSTVTMPDMTTGAVRWVSIAWRIENAAFPSSSAVATGSGTNPNPPNFDPAGDAMDYLWIGIAGCEDTRVVSVFPTNYTNGASQANTTAGGASCTIMGATRQLNAAAENPDSFTITVTSNQHMHYTVAVPPAVVPSVGRY